MKITFEKRIYNIEDGDDVYKLTEIIKHPIEEYDYRHIVDGFLNIKNILIILNVMDLLLKNFQKKY